MNTRTAKIMTCAKHLLAFTVATLPKYFINWHHRAVASALQEVERGFIKRLMIFMPPRHGKSELVSRRFPPWYLGRHPEEELLGCSYGSSLASEFGGTIKDIMTSQLYKEIFGNLLTATSSEGFKVSRAVTTNKLLTLQGGAYRSSGVTGGITGKGMHGGIVDDPIKSRKEANSITYRNSVWDWWRNEFYTRLEPDGWIILTTTRWHEDDLAGRLLRQAKDEGGDEWTVLNLPAICENPDAPYERRKLGEALWPEKYSLERLEKIKIVLQDLYFNSLFQQRPTILGGNIFKRDKFKYYLTRPPRFDRVLQSWDLTFKDTGDSAYVVGQVWGQIARDFYLLHQDRAKLDFSKTLVAILRTMARFPEARTKLIEDKANGPAVISALRKRVPGIKAIDPKASKLERAELASEPVELGHVYLPDPKAHPWVETFLEEVCNFPKAPNSDQVDTFTQAINYMNRTMINFDIMDIEA